MWLLYVRNGRRVKELIEGIYRKSNRWCKEAVTNALSTWLYSQPLLLWMCIHCIDQLPWVPSDSEEMFWTFKKQWFCSGSQWWWESDPSQDGTMLYVSLIAYCLLNNFFLIWCIQREYPALISKQLPWDQFDPICSLSLGCRIFKKVSSRK